MDKARGDLLGLGPFQQADERCGSGFQRPISGTQSCGPFAAPMEHARRAERRAKSHGQGPSALEPMCGQLPRTRPLPITEQFLGCRPLQPADGQHPQIRFPGQQRRDANRRAVPKPRGDHGLVQRGLRRRLLCVSLDCEATGPRPHFNGGALTRSVAAQEQFDGTVVKGQRRERDRQALGAENCKRGQSRIIGKFMGLMVTQNARSFGYFLV